MSTHKAVVLSSFDTRTALETLPTPTATSGSAIIQVLASTISPDYEEILTGAAHFPLKFPLTIGNFCIGRVQSLGPDATSLRPGQLVVCDGFISARDDPNLNFLPGLHAGVTPDGQKLMEGEWRHGTYAEVVKLPLEAVYPLNEEKLCKKLGYTYADLTMLQYLSTPYGGLADAEVKPGDTLIVAPATGRWGGATIPVALALGARVIAVGRSKDKLATIKRALGAEEDRLVTVALEGDVEKDSTALKAAAGGRGADVYIDFSPPAAGAHGPPKHVKSCMLALRARGKVVVSGGVHSEIPISYPMLVFNHLSISGNFMYEPEQMRQLIRMVEGGILKLGKDLGTEVVGPYDLANFQAALGEATRCQGWGKNVVLTP